MIALEATIAIRPTLTGLFVATVTETVTGHSSEGTGRTMDAAAAAAIVAFDPDAQ